MYGICDGHDVYFLLAMWNRKNIVDNLSPDIFSNKGIASDEDFQKNVNDFFNLEISDADLYKAEKDIEESIRIIGIDTNFSRKDCIKYPLKFIEDVNRTDYDSLPESEDDPEQGFNRYIKGKGSFVGTCVICGREVWSEDNYGSWSEPCCSNECMDEAVEIASYQGDFSDDEEEHEKEYYDYD